jgi:hypothetical protein
MEILREAGQADVHDLDRAMEEVRGHQEQAEGAGSFPRHFAGRHTSNHALT